MADGPKRPVAAAVMGLVMLALAAAGGLLAYLTAAYGGADYWRIASLVSSVGTIALLVVGGRAVVRLAQGRRVGAVAAVFVGLVTGAGVFVCSVVWLWAIGMTEGDFGRPVPVGEKAFGWFVIAALLVGGLWCAWRIGSGRWGLRRRPAPDAAEGSGNG